jgi:hypothetical protein
MPCDRVDFTFQNDIVDYRFKRKKSKGRYFLLRLRNDSDFTVTAILRLRGCIKIWRELGCVHFLGTFFRPARGKKNIAYGNAL